MEILHPAHTQNKEEEALTKEDHAQKIEEAKQYLENINAHLNQEGSLEPTQSKNPNPKIKIVADDEVKIDNRSAVESSENGNAEEEMDAAHDQELLDKVKIKKLGYFDKNEQQLSLIDEEEDAKSDGYTPKNSKRPHMKISTLTITDIQRVNGEREEALAPITPRRA